MEQTTAGTPATIPPVVAAIGGIDPSGGAGLFVDQLAVRSTGCDFVGICSTVTIQNGVAFLKSTPQPASDVAAALDLIHEHKPIAALKTGALGHPDIVDEVCRFAARHPEIPVIVDPVLKSTTGGTLLSETDAISSFKKLMSRATLITPNLHEAAALTDVSVETVAHMEIAAARLLDMGARGVLLKGGHLCPSSNVDDADDAIVDVLAQAGNGVIRMTSRRLNIGEVRGTGCALASLIAGQIALGESIENGVEKARRALLTAMRNARFPKKGPGQMWFSN